MKRGKRNALFALAGFLLCAGASWAYAEWGSWNFVPVSLTFPTPRPAWARIAFAPGVAVARACFHGFLKDVFVFRVALHIAGAIGVLSMGALGALAGRAAAQWKG